jgi:hypothetical protein
MTVHVFLLFCGWKEDCTVSECFSVAVMSVVLPPYVHFTESGITNSVPEYNNGKNVIYCSADVIDVLQFARCEEYYALIS